MQHKVLIFRASRKCKWLYREFLRAYRQYSGWSLTTLLINALYFSAASCVSLCRRASSFALRKSGLIDSFYTKRLYNIAGSLGIARSSDSASQRYYLKANIEPQEFVEFINKNVNYVALRWVEMFPDNWNQGQDLDILVSDPDLHKVLGYCTKTKGLYAIDIYSDRYRPGFIFGNSPYLPAKVCRRLFKSRYLLNDTIYVAGNAEYVLTFFYHLLIHKGERSGLGTEQNSCSSSTSPVTRYILEAIRLNRDLYTLIPSDPDGYTSINANSIYTALSENDWLPNLSMIRSLALSNQLLREVLLTKGQLKKEGYISEVMTFIIRQRAIDLELIQQIEAMIESSNLQIVDSSKIEQNMIPCATHEIRSGNWSQNDKPLRKSGGKPGHVIVCLDHNPTFRHCSDSVSSHPFALNLNLSIKTKIRKSIDNAQPFWMQAHLIHSADDEAEALEYITECYVPKKRSDIIDLINYSKSTYKPHSSRFASLTPRGKRSHVYLCVKNNAIVVRKDYRSDKLRYMSRELMIYKHFSSLSFVPSFVGNGTNFIEYAFVHGTPASELINSKEGKTMVKRLVRSIMEEAYLAGIALLDFSPSNLIIDENGKGWVIDYEYSCNYGASRPSGGFMQGYDYAGLPADFEGDNPVGTDSSGRSYANTWLEYLGPL